MGGCAEEEDIPVTPNSASYGLQTSLSTGAIYFVPKNMHGAGCCDKNNKPSLIKKNIKTKEN